ncbi:MAG: ABC transporter permease [Gemmatimonadota bacterium]|nr:ABC transporter permease [Gemmatimonadota bacterium]
MQLGSGLRRFFRWPATPRGVDREVEAELAFHIESRAEALMARGMSAESARAEAMREFGNVADASAELGAIDRERMAHAARSEWLDALRIDLRFAMRSLRRQPAWVAVAVATLSLGIGANAAIFSIVNAVLLRPLPYANPDQLVSVWPEASVPHGVFVMLRDQTRSFSGIAGYSGGRDVSVLAGGEPMRLTDIEVTADLFGVLGAGAQVGRVFTTGDDQSGHDRIAILSHALWRTRFAGDANIIGRTITIDGMARTIVGVMPAEFRFPSPRAELWTPSLIDPANGARHWWMTWMKVVGRVAPGVTSPQARGEVRGVLARARGDFPMRMSDSWGRDADVIPLKERFVRDTRRTLLVLLGAVSVVLLIACVNVANLCVARAASREREIAIRAALGAGRSRVVRQLLTESLLLAMLGAAGGLALACVAVRSLVTFLPADTPRVTEIALDARVLAFTLGVGLITGIAFGLAPALRVSRADLHSTLGAGSRGSSAGRSRRRLSESLVIAQVALAVVLVAGAGLLIKSFWVMRQADLGFRAERVVRAEVPLPSFPSDTAARARVFYDAVLERVRAIPGVRTVALANVVPFGGGIGTSAMDIEAQPTPPGGAAPTLEVSKVTPDYLRVMEIPLLAGRALDDADREGAGAVGLVDDAAAKKFWPGRSAIGQRVKYVWQKSWIIIVGVVGNVKRDSLSSAPEASLYIPMRQQTSDGMRLLVRGDLDAQMLAPRLRAAVASVDRTVPVSNVVLLRELVSASASRARFTTMMLALFAGVALSLGAVGIYGVIAYGVARRTREIGVRMALGARRRDVVGLVLREGGALVTAGVVIGTIGALITSRVLSSLLYGVAPTDLVVFASVPLILASVAMIASIVPARRAAMVDPLTAMRAD